MKAFPTNLRVSPDQADTGMDLRDYFAAKALSQMGLPTKCIGSRWSGNTWNFDDWDIENIEKFAGLAYKFADAMMKVREEK